MIPSTTEFSTFFLINFIVNSTVSTALIHCMMFLAQHVYILVKHFNSLFNLWLQPDKGVPNKVINNTLYSDNNLPDSQYLQQLANNTSTKLNSAVLSLSPRAGIQLQAESIP